MRARSRSLLSALLLLTGVDGTACPLCQGWGQPSWSQMLVSAPRVVLAVPMLDGSHFRVMDVLKGASPSNGVVEAGDSRSLPVLGMSNAAGDVPRLLVQEDPFPTWVIVGTTDAAHAGWLRTLASGRPAAERSAGDWAARVVWVVPHLEDPDPLSADLACSELSAAPYAALQASRAQLDAAVFRRGWDDPELAARRSLYLVLLGLSGNDRDAEALERRLLAAGTPEDATLRAAMLTADLELRGPDRLAWVETHYLVDPKCPAADVRAALHALAIHGGAEGAISRDRVVQSYRKFIGAHPEIAGDVAVDLASWKRWEAVPDYLALMKSGVRQQYPSLKAMQAYLDQSPNGAALGASARVGAAPGAPSSP